MSTKKLTFLLIFLFIPLHFPVQAKPPLTRLQVSTETVMIPMRDGVYLATDLYFPQDMSSPKTTLLLRTPYDKSDTLVVLLANQISFEEKWVVAVQDVRGMHESEGEFLVFANASTDGYDTMKWIVQQEWSNGNVITAGISALGIIQYLQNLLPPPWLKAQYVSMATPNLYADAIFQNGAYRQELVEPWLESLGKTDLIPLVKEHEQWSTFWLNTSFNEWEQVQAPAIHVGGWYDIFLKGTINAFNGYQYHSLAPVRGNSFLIIGPWAHANFVETQGELTYPNATDAFSFDFFKTLVQAQLTNNQELLQDKPRIMYYVMGPDTVGSLGNFWVQTNNWPTPEYTNYYLTSNGRLSLEQPQSQPLSKHYLYDPRNPVPTIGGANLNINAGPYDQSMLENRSDILYFTTPVLDEPIAITGGIRAELFVSSNVTDTDFMVKLMDKYPDGRSMLIQDGVIRMRWRDGPTTPTYMTPGEIYKINIDLWNTSYIFNPGHQIQLSITSSNYPRFSINPNNGNLLNQTNGSVFTANQTIYLSSQYPSKLVLPTIPLNTLLQTQSTNSQTPSTQENEPTTKKVAFSIFSVLVANLTLILIIRLKKIAINH